MLIGAIQIIIFQKFFNLFFQHKNFKGKYLEDNNYYLIKYFKKFLYKENLQHEKK